MRQRVQAMIMLIMSMLIFGSIGLFVRNIALPSSVIAFTRAFIGVLFLLIVLVIAKRGLSINKIKQNAVLLLLSGAAIGFNWILLFESYRYTSLAVSTLCYYMAPVIVTILSPFVLKEKLTVKRFLCVFVAVVGMSVISGVFKADLLGVGEGKGIAFGLGAAILYATVIILNKHLKQIEAIDRTICQLFAAALVILPYCLIATDWSIVEFTPKTIVLLAVVGIVHTGFAYYLYFGSMQPLRGQSIAVASYIDPVVAVLASVFLLREPCDVYTIIGAIAILGAMLLSELPSRREVVYDN